MPVHDWSRVEAGIFHHFHLTWIDEIQRTLNGGLLPKDYYALAEQYVGGVGPDVLALQIDTRDANDESVDPQPMSGNGVQLLAAPPQVRYRAEGELNFYRRKQKSVVIHHISDDSVVALVEIMSPGNKSSSRAIEDFLTKVDRLMKNRIHMLIIDLHLPTKRDPNGIHGAIWEDIVGQEYKRPTDKPLTQAAYECDLGVRAHVEPMAVGDSLIEMPLYLQPGGYVLVPLEKTYRDAFAAVPQRWRSVLESA